MPDPAGRILTTRAELLEQGCSSAWIQREQSSGAITRATRGVYSAGPDYRALGTQDQHMLRARAASIAAPTLVVSHVSAALLHGLPIVGVTLDRVHLTRPGSGGNERSDWRVLHSGLLRESEIVEISGARTTSLARTLVDLARMAPFDAGVIAADAALHHRPGIIADLVETLARARFLRGAAVARRALLFADGRAESVGESRLRIFSAAQGLPVIQPQCNVVNRRGTFVGRADLGYLEHGVLMEFDGRIKYGLEPGSSPLDVVLREKRREDDLRELGWQVLRVIWSDLQNRDGLAARIRAMLVRGARALAVNGIAGSVTPLAPVRLPR
jgi:predicted transcriptional regulator of viral defense system